MFLRRSRRRSQSEKDRRNFLFREQTNPSIGRYDLMVNPYQRADNYPQSTLYDLQIVVLRHGERVDLKFGPDWFENLLYDKNTGAVNYRNPNLPRNLPRRREAFHYILDPPITRNGEDNARKFGSYLRPVIQSVDFCYSSSPCRCVLTANALLKGLRQDDVAIRLEPYLFEPMNWNSALHMFPQISSGLSRGNWLNANYKVDTRYHRLGRTIDPNENEEGFYQRTKVFVQQIINQHEYRQSKSPRKPLPSTVLVIGHASSPIVFGDILAGKAFDLKSFKRRSDNVSFLETHIFRRRIHDGQWTRQRAPPPFTS